MPDYQSNLFVAAACTMQYHSRFSPSRCLYLFSTKISRVMKNTTNGISLFFFLPHSLPSWKVFCLPP